MNQITATYFRMWPSPVFISLVWGSPINENKMVERGTKGGNKAKITEVTSYWVGFVYILWTIVIIKSKLNGALDG